MGLTLDQKQEIQSSCLMLLDERITRLTQHIQEAQTAASEDTKSSAGDKYETGREMLKQEINKLNLQLNQANQMRQQLNRLSLSASPFGQVVQGSLVQTSEGLYYFAIGLGKVQSADQVVMVISMQSPIGKALNGRQVGDRMAFMGREIEIQAIC